MTHILQATHETWYSVRPADTGNDTIYMCYSPVFTVEIESPLLYMDVVIYDGGLVESPAYDCQVQYLFQAPRTTGDFGTAYNVETDFYYQHHHTFSPPYDPFTTVVGIPIQKAGGNWLVGDTFQVVWQFFGRSTTICGLKSIGIYK